MSGGRRRYVAKLTAHLRRLAAVFKHGGIAWRSATVANRSGSFWLCPNGEGKNTRVREATITALEEAGVIERDPTPGYGTDERYRAKRNES
jgi:hypothetical protein